jgi:GTPase SAR1 family protein
LFKELTSSSTHHTTGEHSVTGDEVWIFESFRLFAMRLKICVVGPKAVGKTAISNYLSGQSPSVPTDGKYEPTAGVRILEYEAHSSQGPVGIELWDASGDTSFVPMIWLF